MPIVRIDIEAGKSTAYKREILHGVRDAIATALGVTGDRIYQRIVETPSEDIDTPVGRTDRLTMIEISMLAGRDLALKEEMYRGIVTHLGFKPGIDSHDIVVIVHEAAGECFCIGGNLPGESSR